MLSKVFQAINKNYESFLGNNLEVDIPGDYVLFYEDHLVELDQSG